MSLEIGQIVDGKYRIEKLIGEGGMGAVYLGENTRIRRKVAIKVLHAATAENGDAVARFEREAQAAGTIGNDHIMEILDLGALPDGARYMVMEFLDGQPLSDRIRDNGRLSPAQAYPLMRQALEGLGAAHAAGIIHRDLKPDNLFVLREKAGQRDYVKIIDFGISKFQPMNGEAAMNMTRTGAIMGTPYYMSPEQASGSREADNRSDLYTMGVILYECVTGQVPFDAKSVNELLFKIVLSTPPPPETIVPDLDPAFSSIIAKSMAREVDGRFQSSADFIAALDAWAQSGSSVSVPPPHDARASMVAKLDALPSAKQTTGGAVKAKTSSTWATSQSGGAEQAPPKRNSAPIAVAAAVGVLVLVGGVGAFVMTRGRSQAPEVPAAAAQPPPAATAIEPPKPPPVDTKPAESAAAVEKPAASAVPAAVAAAPGKPGAKGAAAAKPAATPAPEKPAAAKPAGKPASTAPDFGY